MDFFRSRSPPPRLLLVPRPPLSLPSPIDSLVLPSSDSAVFERFAAAALADFRGDVHWLISSVPNIYFSKVKDIEYRSYDNHGNNYLLLHIIKLLFSKIYN